MGFAVLFGVDDPPQSVPGDVAAAFAQIHALDLFVDEAAHGPAAGVEGGTFCDGDSGRHLPFFPVFGENKSRLPQAHDVEAHKLPQEPAGGEIISPGITGHEETHILFPPDGHRVADDETVFGFALEHRSVFPAHGTFTGHKENGFGVCLLKGDERDLPFEAL